MGVKIQKGFTIIELVLFLGITGLVMGVLLVGVGGSLNRERYRDAVTSFQDYLQGQYNLVTNVNNSRDATDPCVGGKIEVGGTADAGRGTSDCTVVGRVIYSSDNGESVSSSQVYATVDAATLSGVDDVQLLQNANLIASPAREEYTIGWTTTLVNQRPDESLSKFSILIVRVPTNGLVHTYMLPDTGKTPAAIVGNQIPTGGLHICVDNSMFVTGGIGRTGVILARDAANSGGVQFASETDC